MTFVNPTQPMAMQTLYQLCYMPPLGLATLIMTLGEIMGTPRNFITLLAPFPTHSNL
jgi:hypothetical protein